jgi:hypothetical protein
MDEFAPSPDTAAMYCMILLAASVFPAPDSPLRKEKGNALVSKNKYKQQKY